MMARTISYVAALERLKQELSDARASAGVPSGVRDAIRQGLEDTADEDAAAQEPAGEDRVPIEFDPAIVTIVGVVGRKPIKGTPAPSWPEAAVSRASGVRAAAFRPTFKPGEPNGDPAPSSPSYTGLVSTTHGPMDIWDDGERAFVELPDAEQPIALRWRGTEYRLLPLPGREMTFEVDGLTAVDAADIIDGES